MASAKPDFALPPQTVLHAHYLLGDTLGGGALGITYRAVQLDAPRARQGGRREGVFSARPCCPGG